MVSDGFKQKNYMHYEFKIAAKLLQIGTYSYINSVQKLIISVSNGTIADQLQRTF